MQKRKYILTKGLTDYEQDIRSLIPTAEIEAMLKVVDIGKAGELRPGAGGKVYFHSFFTEFFHKSMTRLAIEKGIRGF